VLDSGDSAGGTSGAGARVKAAGGGSAPAAVELDVELQEGISVATLASRLKMKGVALVHHLREAMGAAVAGGKGGKNRAKGGRRGPRGSAVAAAAAGAADALGLDSVLELEVAELAVMDFGHNPVVIPGRWRSL
jgi:hypothetical protein